MFHRSIRSPYPADVYGGDEPPGGGPGGGSIGTIPPELLAAAKKAGIDVSTLTGGGQTDYGSLYNVQGAETTSLTIRRNVSLLPSRGDYLSGATGGNETSTVLDTLQGFYDLSPTEMRQLKQRLFAHGFYDGTTPPPLTAEPDDATLAAYRKAVLRAARGGESLWDDVLKPTKDDAAARGFLKPTEARYLNEQVLPSLIGRKLSEPELRRFVVAVGNATDPTSILSPSDQFNVAVSAATRSAAPGAQESYGLLQRMDQFIGLLDQEGGGVGKS